MNIENSFRLSLKIYAIISFAAAILHGMWFWFFPTYPELKELTMVQQNIIFLFNWSITLLHFIFSILSFLVSISKETTLNQLKIFSAIMIGLWVCRLFLEFIFPVQIPFVFIPNPSAPLKIFIVFIIIILAIPHIQSRFNKN